MREGLKIELNQIVTGSEKAVNEFLNWLKNNDNISEYETDSATTELTLGCLVYGEETKWYRLKGMFYTFFDFNYICVEIGIDKTMEAKYCYEISTHTDFEWSARMSDLFYTRAEAEYAAFIDAFNVLEVKLTS